MHFHEVLQSTQDNISKRPLPEQITVQLDTIFDCQNKSILCKKSSIYLTFVKHCFAISSSTCSFSTDDTRNSQGDEFERNISKVESLVRLPICYVHSWIADAAKGPKTPISYLLVISLVFIVRLPTENIIPLLACHRAMVKVFFFIARPWIVNRLGTRHLGTSQHMGSDRIWWIIVKTLR